MSVSARRRWLVRVAILNPFPAALCRAGTLSCTLSALQKPRFLLGLGTLICDAEGESPSLRMEPSSWLGREGSNRNLRFSASAWLKDGICIKAFEIPCTNDYNDIANCQICTFVNVITFTLWCAHFTYTYKMRFCVCFCLLPFCKDYR